MTTLSSHFSDDAGFHQGHHAPKRHRRGSPPRWAIELARALVSTVIAVGGAAWTARSVIAGFEQHLVLLDQHVAQHDEAIKDVVPRHEQEAHWEAVDRQLSSIREDVREARKDVRELLTQRSKP